MDKKLYDLIIIGAGPAGLSASLYASRYAIKHLIFGKLPGGLISETHEIDNYLGLGKHTGSEFSRKILDHVKNYGTEVNVDNIKKIQKTGKIFELKNEKKELFKAKTILLALGTERIKLSVKGEESLLGRGVSYCATCDGFFYRSKDVVVVGGSDSAAGAAVHLADLCRKVTLIYRKGKLRAEPFWTKILTSKKNIRIIYNTELTEIIGKQKVEKVLTNNPKHPAIITNGVFIEIGSRPSSDLLIQLGLESDSNGSVKVKKDQSTSVKGIWAAGDITTGSNGFRQVVTAAAEGAIAARSIYQYLQDNEGA